jgi:hypothetical protein
VILESAYDLFVRPVPVINGMITASERPGHGLAFRPEFCPNAGSEAVPGRRNRITRLG